MITRNNYFTETEKLDFSSMAPDLRRDLEQGDEFIRRVTGNGGDWTGAEVSLTISQTVDSYIALLNQVLTEPVHSPSIEPLSGTPKKKPSRRKTNAKKGRKRRPYRYEREFFVRYLALDATRKSKAQIGAFVDDIQEAIQTRKIKKENPFGKDIMFMQNKLIAVFNDMKSGASRELRINSLHVNDFKEVVSWDGRIPGEILLEKFLKLIGKGRSAKAIRTLCHHFDQGMKRNRVQPKYQPVARKALTLLLNASADGDKVLKVRERLQNEARSVLGIKKDEPIGILNGSDPLATSISDSEWRTDQLPDNSHLQLAFEGKWKSLLNQPTKGFSAMVFGKPKMGKSTLVLEFAGYLVRGGFGNVLWVELEEDIFTTFKEKVDRLQVGHADFFVRNAIPDNLERFDFIVINSVSEGKIKPDEIRELKKQNPGKTFLLIYHTRKDGEFRGGQEHAHLVDVMIEVKKGKAFANGRFGRGETEVRFN